MAYTFVEVGLMAVFQFGFMPAIYFATCAYGGLFSESTDDFVSVA